MRRNLISGFLGASLGAVFMFVLIAGIAWVQTDCQVNETLSEEYIQIEFTSRIEWAATK